MKNDTIFSPEQSSTSSSGTSLCANSAVLQDSTKLTLFSAVWQLLLTYWSTSSEPQWLENFIIIANMFALEMTELTISQLPTNINCKTAQGIITSMNSSYGLLKPTIQKAIYQYLLDYHTKSNLTCDTSDDLQLFITTYFGAFSTLISPKDLVSLIPSDQLSTKLTSLKPEDMIIYLQPDTNMNSTVWSIMLSHYTNISKLGQVMDLLNIKTEDITVTVFKTVWPTFVSKSGFLNDYEMDKWFNVRFNNTIKLITLEQLNINEVITANCLFYQNLVKTLSIHYEDYSGNTRQDIYNVFKNYLQTHPQPKCYTDYSWIVENLQVYITFCSADDLRSFSSNETLLHHRSNEVLHHAHMNGQVFLFVGILHSG
ncbi:uncharacterized protein LOC142656664 [Rhinoderma darwinii]|uniref:uncharacterized protein LOC142656664 n=1 Tax=Rhinoderma darwinii TaxID=43563 RepID=UPI003F66F00F